MLVLMSMNDVSADLDVLLHHHHPDCIAITVTLTVVCRGSAYYTALYCSLFSLSCVSSACLPRMMV